MEDSLEFYDISAPFEVDLSSEGPTFSEDEDFCSSPALNHLSYFPSSSSYPSLAPFLSSSSDSSSSDSYSDSSSSSSRSSSPFLCFSPSPSPAPSAEKIQKKKNKTPHHPASLDPRRLRNVDLSLHHVLGTHKPRLPSHRSLALTEEFLTLIPNRRVHPIATKRNHVGYTFFEDIVTKWRFFLVNATLLTGAKRPNHYFGKLMAEKHGFSKLKIDSKKALPKQCEFLREFFLELRVASGMPENQARMSMNKMYYIYCQTPEQRRKHEDEMVREKKDFEF